jgi:hypothetical protein
VSKTVRVRIVCVVGPDGDYAAGGSGPVASKPEEIIREWALDELVDPDAMDVFIIEADVPVPERASVKMIQGTVRPAEDGT